MNLAELIAKRDSLSATISRLTEQNQRADWGRYTVSTKLLLDKLDDINWRIMEYENPEAYKLEMESRVRRIEYKRREEKRQADALPKTEDTLRQIREYPWPTLSTKLTKDE